MSGLFQELTKVYSINSFASFTTSSEPVVASERSAPLEYGKKTIYASKENNENGEWWQVSLKGRTCTITSYRIMSYHEESDNAHLKSWTLFAGTTEENLEQIDYQENVSELNQPYGEVLINLNKIAKSISVLRLHVNETHFPKSNPLIHIYSHVLRLCEFDIYGSSKWPKHECLSMSYLKNLKIIYFLLLHMTIKQ